MSRGLAPSSPLSFFQSFHCFFLHTAESSVFSKVRVCEAQRSNESPSGAFKRQNGLAQQDGGALPRQVRVCAATNTPVGCLSDRTVCDSRWRGLAPTSSRLRSNKHPSGVFERPNGLRQQMEGPCPDKFAFAQRSGAKKERQILRFGVQYMVHLQGLELWAH